MQYIMNWLEKIENQNLELLKNQRTIMRQLVVLQSNNSSNSNAANTDNISNNLIPASTVAEFTDLEKKCREDSKHEKHLVCTIIINLFTANLTFNKIFLNFKGTDF